MSSPFRILSIDGGGIKGIFPAAFLAELEKSTQLPIHRCFDLIAGTSTGGIIALGLSAGLTAAQIAEFYRSHGPSIFSSPRSILKRLLSPKYSSRNLRASLEGIFQERTLGSAHVRLLIPSYNVNTGDIHIYKTRHHERLLTDFRASMVDVALATTAAPTFFAAHRGAGGALYVDGGVWANNPVGNAVVEAVTWLGIPAPNIDVLSIGCTQFPASNGGEGARWAFRFVETTLRAQSAGSLGIAYSIVGHDHVVRINPVATKGQFGLDDVRGIDDLASFAYLEARKASSMLVPRFLRQEATPFIPFPS